MDTLSDLGCYYYSTQDGFSYEFTTAKGDRFLVSFKRTWVDIFELTTEPENGVDIYEMVFERVEIVNGMFDKYISKTILYIAADFTNQRRVIFYASDNPTKNDKELFRLYDIWYNFLVRENTAQFSHKLEIVQKLNKIVYYPNYTVYFSCFFLPQHTGAFNVDKLFSYILGEIYPNATIIAYEP